MKIYISFGQSHAHRANGKTFDCDVLCEITCNDHAEGRQIAFDHFGNKFGTSYGEADLPNIIHHFPRGAMPL